MLPCTHVVFTLLLALMTQQSTRRRLLASLAFLVRCFFRRVEVTGLENIPKEGGGVLVSWHPNGLVDPALIVTQFPRIVVFGARHGLFQFPILGRFLRALDTVPIHRAIDRSKMSNKGRQAANATALDALAQAVAQGSYTVSASQAGFRPPRRLGLPGGGSRRGSKTHRHYAPERLCVQF